MKMAFTGVSLFILQCTSIILMDLSAADPLIETSTSEITPGITASLDVTCTFSLDNQPGMAGLISLILSRTNRTEHDFEELASITQFVPDSVTLLTQEKVTATGVLGQTKEKFLKVHWEYPTVLQAGIYHCSANVVDIRGHSMELTNISLVTVDEANLNDVVDKLQHIGIQESAMEQRLESLEKEKLSMEQTIQNLENDKISIEKNVLRLEEIVDSLQPIAPLRPVGKYQNNHYYLSKEGFSDVDKAMDVCKSLGGYLATINDQSEFTAIAGFLDAAFGFQPGYVVVAGSDENSEGQWVLPNSNTPMPFMDWAAGRPQINYQWNCVLLSSGLSWSMTDDKCSHDQPVSYIHYMCEIPSV